MPGKRSFARIHLEDEPLALLPGDRFILRGFARITGGGASVGGGVGPRRGAARTGGAATRILLRDLDRCWPRAAMPAPPRGSRPARGLRRASFGGPWLRETRPRGEGELRPAPREAEAGTLWLRAVAAGIWLWPMRSGDPLAIEARLEASLDAFTARAAADRACPAAALRGSLPENVPRCDVAELASGTTRRRGAIVHGGESGVALGAPNPG